MKKIGNLFKNLCKLSGRELLSLLLDLLSLGCTTPSLFTNFFIVFCATNNEMPNKEKFSILIIIAIILLLWLWMINKFKRVMLDDVKPFHRLLPRILYRVRWLMFLVVVLWLYTIKVDLSQMFLYFGLCILTYSLSVIFRCCWLKLNRKDWSYEYDKRTIKF